MSKEWYQHEWGRRLYLRLSDQKTYDLLAPWCRVVIWVVSRFRWWISRRPGKIFLTNHFASGTGKESKITFPNACVNVTMPKNVVIFTRVSSDPTCFRVQCVVWLQNEGIIVQSGAGGPRYVHLKVSYSDCGVSAMSCIVKLLPS